MKLAVDAPPRLISTSDLQGVLANALSEYYAAPHPIVELGRRPSDYRSSFPLEELDVILDDGTRLQLVFKNLSELLEPAHRVKPEFLLNPLREIETYRRILAPNPMGTAICYGALAEPGPGRRWLFLEKVQGVELYQVGEFALWRRVAHWLAEMHTAFAHVISARARAVPLLHYDLEFYQLWLDRAAKCLNRTESENLVQRLARRYDRVTSHLSVLPATFIHGEFYASNVLVQPAPEALRVCPVDWEMAAVGPGLMDLAALIAGKWSEEEKRGLALSYYTALEPDTRKAPPLDDFLTALDYCRLQLAVQWLGWSPGWTPPPDHVHDWLHEALFLAEKLGL